jgi:hypothetical protein
MPPPLAPAGDDPRALRAHIEQLTSTISTMSKKLNDELHRLERSDVGGGSSSVVTVFNSGGGSGGGGSSSIDEIRRGKQSLAANAATAISFASTFSGDYVLWRWAYDSAGNTLLPVITGESAAGFTAKLPKAGTVCYVAIPL